MNARVAGLAAIGVVAGLAIAWVFRPAPRWKVDRPHVVLVIGCTVRADQSTVYTPDLSTTPFLAELAAEGRRFDDAVAAAPWTRAAVAAIVSGRHPAEVGIVEPEAARNDRPLPDGVLTLAEVLGDAGYTTLGVTANPNLDPHFGFDQGFSAYASLSESWRGREVVKVYGDEPVDAALELVQIGRAHV